MLALRSGVPWRRWCDHFFRSVLSGFRGGLGVVRCGVILYSNLLKGVSVHPSNPSNYCSVCGASIDECRSAQFACENQRFFLFFLTTEDVGAHGYTRYIGAFKMSMNQSCDPTQRNPPKDLWLFDAMFWWTSCGQCCILNLSITWTPLQKQRGQNASRFTPKSCTRKNETIEDRS